MPAPDRHLTPQRRQVRAVRRRALADALVAARRASGMTQAELAESAGLSRSAIARLELGESSIGSDRIWDIAAALRIKPSEIFVAAEADEAASETLRDT